MADAAGGWQVVAASLAGTSHIANGLPCQDAHGWRELPGGLLIAAVADGAGSAPRSDEGAELVVEAALEAMAAGLLAAVEAGASPMAAVGDRTDGDRGDRTAAVLRGAFVAAREALLARAAAEGFAPRELACTLALAVADCRSLTAGQVGDGVVLAQGVEGAWRSLLEPQKGEYANEVLLLNAPDALDRLALTRVEDPVALVMSTDGLIRLMLRLPGGEPHPAFLDPLVAFARQTGDPAQARRGLLAFLGSERVCGRTDDDKTLLVALRPTAAAATSAVEDPGVGGITAGG